VRLQLTRASTDVGVTAPTTTRGKGGTSRPNHTLPERNARARKAADGIIWAFGSSKGNEGKVMRTCLLMAVALSAALSLEVASAEARGSGHTGTEQQQRACRTDAVRHCRGVDDDHAIEACLRAHIAKLRPACRQVFERG
jgi:hypothetical protein